MPDTPGRSAKYRPLDTEILARIAPHFSRSARFDDVQAALGMRRTLSTLTRKPECRSNAVKTIGELVDEQCPVCDDGTFIAEGTEAIASFAADQYKWNGSFYMKFKYLAVRMILYGKPIEY